MAGIETTYKFLFASSLIVTNKPTLVKTVLGSCVSVCIFDEENGIGGINHFMLPYWQGNELASPKFGNVAMKKLLEKALRLGADMKNIKAKIFGGGEVLNYENCQFKIGPKNIEVAKIFLREFKIPIVSNDTGGKYGRKITFNTANGEVLCKKIIPLTEGVKSIR